MQAPTKTSNEKPWQRVLLFRVAFGLTIVGMILGATIAFYAGWHENTPLFVVGWLIMFPSILFTLLAGFSCHIFTFDYSLLGRLVPRQPPVDWRYLGSSSTGVTIANDYRGPGSIHFGPGGMLVSVLFYAPVFIHSQEIVSVSNDLWWYVRIDHTSPEILSPIYVRRSVAAEMDRCMPELSLVRS